MPSRREKPKPAPSPDPPPTPPATIKGQAFVVILCPFCGADKPKVVRTSPSEGARWYECRACRVFTSERGTVFKIPMRRGDAGA